MQPGDVLATSADVHALRRDVGFAPDTPVEEGVRRFAEWYVEYYAARLATPDPAPDGGVGESVTSSS